MATRSNRLHGSDQRWMDNVKQEVSRAFEHEEKFRSTDREERMRELSTAFAGATDTVDSLSR